MSATSILFWVWLGVWAVMVLFFAIHVLLDMMEYSENSYEDNSPPIDIAEFIVYAFDSLLWPFELLSKLLLVFAQFLWERPKLWIRDLRSRRKALRAK